VPGDKDVHIHLPCDGAEAGEITGGDALVPVDDTNADRGMCNRHRQGESCRLNLRDTSGSAEKERVWSWFEGDAHLVVVATHDMNVCGDGAQVLICLLCHRRSRCTISAGSSLVREAS
jgi:hypothetical protein